MRDGVIVVGRGHKYGVEGGACGTRRLRCDQLPTHREEWHGEQRSRAAPWWYLLEQYTSEHPITESDLMKHGVFGWEALAVSQLMKSSATCPSPQAMHDDIIDGDADAFDDSELCEIVLRVYNESRPQRPAQKDVTGPHSNSQHHGGGRRRAASGGVAASHKEGESISDSDEGADGGGDFFQQEDLLEDEGEGGSSAGASSDEDVGGDESAGPAEYPRENARPRAPNDGAEWKTMRGFIAEVCDPYLLKQHLNPDL